MADHPSVARAQHILSIARDDGIRELMRYWLAIHPGDRLPSRRDFDPADVPNALKHLVLTDVERDPYRFRIRVMGTAVVAAFGEDYTGLYMHTAIGDFESTRGYTSRVEVVESGLPDYRHGIANMVFRLDFAPLERVYLPFATDGINVDMILGMMIYLAADK